MNYQWFILEQGKEVGPATGKELKKMADTGGITPITPVRRASLAGSSHWIRAGTIKALFHDNVVDQLGPPICDDCGSTLPNVSCATCNSYSPLLSDVEDFSENTAPPQSEPQPTNAEPTSAIELFALESHSKPPDIQRDINVLQIIAKTLMPLALILVVFFVVLFANDVIASGRADVILGALAFMLLITIVAYLVYVITMTLVDALRGLLDKVEKARRTGFSSQSRLAKHGKHK